MTVIGDWVDDTMMEPEPTSQVAPGWVVMERGGDPAYYDTAKTARQAAEMYVGECYEPESGTAWIDVWAWRTVLDEDGDVDEWDGEHIDEQDITITIEPEEPDCAEGEEHDWRSPYSVLGGLRENPGVQGHGGGVVIREVCRHCGAYRITDTWAQRMDTGEQGLESVEYEEADEESLAWAESEEA